MNLTKSFTQSSSIVLWELLAQLVLSVGDQKHSDSEFMCMYKVSHSDEVDQQNIGYQMSRIGKY